jgi:hypothetical protein
VSVFLNNNLLIAQDLKEIKDAMEDGHTLHLPMFNPTVLLLRLPIPMLLKIKLARPKEDPSKFKDSAASPDALDCPTESTPLPSQSLLMPPTGAPINQESSTTAEQALTMPSSWLVSKVETGRSRIHGELDGERVDTLDLLVEIHAVSAHMPVLLSIIDPIRP